MIRQIRDIIKIYSEGKREYIFIDHILQITNNKRKFYHTNLGGGGHKSMIEKVISDYFNGEKICIIDNSNRAKKQIPLLEQNAELLRKAKTHNISLIISKNQFDDEIIDFLGIPKSKNEKSKITIDKYLERNNTHWREYVKLIINNKTYIKNNLSKLKNINLKNLLSKIINSYKADRQE